MTDLFTRTAQNLRFLANIREREGTLDSYQDASVLREDACRLQIMATSSTDYAPAASETIEPDDVTDKMPEAMAQVSGFHLGYYSASEKMHQKRRIAAAINARQPTQEVKMLKAEVGELKALCDRLSGLLRRTAVALRGPEPPFVQWGWHDLPELAAELRSYNQSKPTLPLVFCSPESEDARDRLILAAKAAGYTLGAHSQNPWAVCVGGAEWNPATDDSAALLLAIALSLEIRIAEDSVAVSHTTDSQITECRLRADRGALRGISMLYALRQAILSVAAAVGRNMPGVSYEVTSE